jgi:hypothetical protein
MLISLFFNQISVVQTNPQLGNKVQIYLLMQTNLLRNYCCIWISKKSAISIIANYNICPSLYDWWLDLLLQYFHKPKDKPPCITFQAWISRRALRDTRSVGPLISFLERVHRLDVGQGFVWPWTNRSWGYVVFPSSAVSKARVLSKLNWTCEDRHFARWTQVLVKMEGAFKCLAVTATLWMSFFSIARKTQFHLVVHILCELFQSILNWAQKPVSCQSM